MVFPNDEFSRYISGFWFNQMNNPIRYNMKLMKVLIHKCNIIGDIPDFIECHIRLNKRGEEGNSSIINYTYNLKLNKLLSHS